ncbi:MAG: hypothetical protein L6Q40_05475 [Azonexus sp.]|nr:hypothetical protein [Azonexus sp.]
MPDLTPHLPAGRKARIGIVGTGFIATGLTRLLLRQPDLTVSYVLSRRPAADCHHFPAPGQVGNDIQALIDHSDLVVECSGDVLHGTMVIDRVIAAGLPVVTMEAELQVTTGSYFVDRGLLTEAEGDQPGCLAALHEDAVAMGFSPLVYGNIKGFLNNDPAPDEMRYWAEKQGISLTQVTGATDGTKVQVEQALVANGLGARITQTGLSYLEAADLHSAGNTLGQLASARGHALSDCVMSAPAPAPKLPAGVFITATHDPEQQSALNYYKLGDGPYYTLLRPFYLPHLEIPKTIRRVLGGGGVLLNNGLRPRASVGTLAKRPLLPGEYIAQGSGSFAVRGTALEIDDHPGHLPIGLMQQAHIKRRIEAGDLLTMDDVDLPDTLAVRAWQAILDRRR